MNSADYFNYNIPHSSLGHRPETSSQQQMSEQPQGHGTVSGIPCTVSSMLSYSHKQRFQTRIPQTPSHPSSPTNNPTASYLNPQLPGHTPSGPVRRSTLVAFAIYDCMLGSAGLDECHTLVCGQTAPYNVDMDRSARDSTSFAAKGRKNNNTTLPPRDPATIPDVSLKSTKHYNEFQTLQQRQVISLIRPGKAANGSSLGGLRGDEDEADSSELMPPDGLASSLMIACPSLQRAMWMQRIAEEMCEVLLRFSSSLVDSSDVKAPSTSRKNTATTSTSVAPVDSEAQFDLDEHFPGELIVLFPSNALSNPAALLTTALEMYQLRAPHELFDSRVSSGNTALSAQKEDVEPGEASGKAPNEKEDELLSRRRSCLPTISVRMVPPSDFSVKRCFSCLDHLWPSVTGCAWAAKLDFGNTAMVLALSAACSFVISADRRDGGPFLVADVMEGSASSTTIRMDRGTFDSLQVFRMEPHPAAVHSIGSPKDGLSLHHVFHNKTHSFLGRTLLRQWLKSPSCSAEVLQRRLDLVDLFVSIQSGRHPSSFSSSSSAHSLIPTLQKLLRSLQHPPDALVSRVQAERHSVQDYKSILHSATALMDICRLLYPFSTIAVVEVAVPSPIPRPLAEALRIALQLGITIYPIVDTLLAACQPDALRELITRISSTVDLSATSSASGVVTGNSKMAAHREQTTKLQARTARASGMVKATILPGVNPTLDELRKCYETIDFDTFLSSAAQSEMDGLPPYFSHLVVQVAFMPHLGYLAVLNEAQVVSSAGRSDGGFGSPAGSVGHTAANDGAASVAGTNYAELAASLPHGWDLLFVNGPQLYSKTPRTRELDQNVGDLHVAIRDLTSSALRSLNDDIVRLSYCLTAIRHTAEIDVALALALVAVEEGWSRPQMFDNEGTGSGLVLVNAYHPLLSRCTNTPVVPFSVSLGHNPMCAAESCQSGDPCDDSFEPLPPTPRIAVLTGSHGSGKSVCQRAVGLIVFLAHIGSYVPAEYALIPLRVDNILAVDSSTPTSLFDLRGVSRAATSTAQRRWDLHSRGNGDGKGGGCVSHQTDPGAPNLLLLRSSFGKEVAAMCRALDVCSGHTLLLVDEFGKGTLAADGVALLAAVISDLHERPRERSRPMALFSTHYTEIFERNLVSPKAVSWLHMKVAVVERGIAVEEKVDRTDGGAANSVFSSSRGRGEGGRINSPFFVGSPIQTDHSFRQSPLRFLTPSTNSLQATNRRQSIFDYTPNHYLPSRDASPGVAQFYRNSAVMTSRVGVDATPSWPAFPHFTPRTAERNALAKSDSAPSSVATSRSAYVSLHKHHKSGGVGSQFEDGITWEVLPLFQLERCSLGTMVKSALETARMVGVPPVILDRAQSVLKILVAEYSPLHGSIEPAVEVVSPDTVPNEDAIETNSREALAKQDDPEEESPFSNGQAESISQLASPEPLDLRPIIESDASPETSLARSSRGSSHHSVVSSETGSSPPRQQPLTPPRLEMPVEDYSP